MHFKALRISSCVILQQVQKHLDQFITAMQELFEHHKAAAGYSDCQLVVM